MQSRIQASRPFRHHGGTGAMIAVALVNLALSIATLSIWRFWGRTKVRRLLWSGVTAWDDPVEYTGTGGELFKGFLVALVVIYLPLLGLYTWAQALVVSGDPLGTILLSVLYPLTVFLIAAGAYRARRYQLSRTLWRGIRGGQTGSAWGYALRSMAVWLLLPLTLGWVWPWGEMWLARYRLDNTCFGDRRFCCDAGVAGLYGRFAVAWLCIMAYVGLVSLLFVQTFLDSMQTGELDEAAAPMIPVMLLGAVIVMTLPWAWYRAGFYRAMAGGTTFEGARFSAQVTTWTLIRLSIGNGLISLFSLGVLRPWVALRIFRFACGVLAVDGVPDFAGIRQGWDKGPKTGEGMVSVLDGVGEF
ncbi:DUF898 domain-containing protein [Paramagnetospirillum kuznetsovii]|uniref:DUF898 domain-containing protein n=1 Tax=Paramagnetospirillum kuznetsovii TaxID=2053833 RepID=A0A364NYM9_9PROT|nr:YjgN family protein [Paramagnetospirillum kuznetsovii]RAU22110.1 DUF898 domain-containing protein [Paramagnetospirillum kuznetsovii]